MTKKLTVEELIRRARETHGDRYDYSQTEYNGYTAKLKIICKIHGEFYQRYSHHIAGANCPACSKRERYTTERYIEEAKKIHGDKYDYSKVNYVNNKTEIEVICPKHGSFFTPTSHHLSGSRGCPNCSTAPKQLTTEEFIKRAKKVHGDKYDYSKVNYITQLDDVIIICPKHGEFLQCAKTHMRGFGCSKCGGVYKPTTEEFIENCKKVHGDKYDYSKVEYVNNKSKVMIICKTHGEFLQNPNNHLSGSDCPKCACASISKEGMEWLDELGIPEEYREKTIILHNGRRVRVDALDEKNKIVYEYDCYFFHGSPNMDLEKIHPIIGVKYKELYNKTIKRRNAIIKSGYSVIYTYGE